LAPWAALFAITLGNDDFVHELTAWVSISMDHGGIELPEALHLPRAECRDRIRSDLTLHLGYSVGSKSGRHIERVLVKKLMFRMAREK